MTALYKRVEDENLRLERELDIARVLQTALLPRAPRVDGFDVAGRMTPEVREQRRKRSLLQIEGSGWDVGQAVAYLASDEARWVTGVILPVDAGAMAGSAPSPGLKPDTKPQTQTT